MIKSRNQVPHKPEEKELRAKDDVIDLFYRDLENKKLL